MRLFATASLMLLLPATGVAASRYADRYHVVTPSFGCVVPWTTWALNDERNPRRRDARWVNRVVEHGGCRLVGPIQEWERVGRVGRLVLLRLVPSRVGATPLLFRPADLRVGQIAVPVPAAPGATTVPAPPGQPGPERETSVPPPVAASATTATLAAAMPTAATQTGAGDPPPPPAVPGPAPGKQAPAPDADPPAASSAASGPATQEPSAITTQEPSAAATPEPPIVATPLPAPATQGAPTLPASGAAAPAPAVPPSAQAPSAQAPSAQAPSAEAPSAEAPAAAVPDAVVPPPAAAPAHAADIPAAIRTGRSRFNIGLAAALAVLACLAIICLRLLAGRRRNRQAAEQPPAELFNVPELAADEADVPPIDHNAYRRWCVDSLKEAGWQARMSFPAGRLTADIIARRDGRLLTVQCRPSTRPLEATVVQEALLVRRAQDAQVAAVVSNAGYTMAARTLAAASGVRLLHETELPEFVN